MLQYDFEQSVGCWLTRSAQAYERALNAELAPRGITFRQVQVLGWLAHEGELSQTELAERMHVEPPTLVGILDRMERDGWISRHDCPTDRRKKLIRTEQQAEPVWAEIVECARKVRTCATAGLEPEQIQLLKQLLDRVLENLDSETAMCSPKRAERPATTVRS